MQQNIGWQDKNGKDCTVGNIIGQSRRKMRIGVLIRLESKKYREGAEISIDRLERIQMQQAKLKNLVIIQKNIMREIVEVGLKGVWVDGSLIVENTTLLFK